MDELREIALKKGFSSTRAAIYSYNNFAYYFSLDILDIFHKGPLEITIVDCGLDLPRLLLWMN